MSQAHIALALSNWACALQPHWLLGKGDSLWQITNRIAARATAIASSSTKDYELSYWTNELGVSRDELKSAVQKVGPMAKDVREHLGKSRSATAGGFDAGDG